MSDHTLKWAASYSKDSTSETHTLTFTLEFPYQDDTVYLAYCYPYTYSFLQDYLLQIQVLDLGRYLVTDQC